MDRVLAIVSLLCIVVLAVKAGTCFRKRGVDGKCKRPIISGINRTQCCSLRASFFTETDYTDWFMLSVRNGGADNCSAACGNDCQQVVCPQNQVCDLVNGEPVCKCQVICSTESRRLRTLCASDGRTYTSECSMERAKCRRNDLRTSILHYGICGTKNQSCYSGRCPRGRVCVATLNGRAECQVRLFFPCPEPGPQQPQYCGVDGTTYPTRCHMLKEGQRRGREVAFSRGACPEPAEQPRSVSSLRWLSLK